MNPFGRFATKTASLLCLGLVSLSAWGLTLPGPLVDGQWLQSNMADKNLVIVDVRTHDDFTKFGYIPGARWWDWGTVRVDRKVDGVALESVVPTQAQFEELMQGLGIKPGSQVVIVPLAHSPSSFTQGTRAYWTLKYFGHDRVALLDGGMAKWVAEKKPTQLIPATVRELSQYRAQAVRSALLAKTVDVLAAVQGKQVQLLDGRTTEFYAGKSKKDYVYAHGHIAGARQFANTELLDPKTKALKPVAELRDQMAKSGIDASKPLITYCDSGHLSTGAWFVAHELLGNKQARLYDGSMHEWTKDRTRPVEATAAR